MICIMEKEMETTIGIVQRDDNRTLPKASIFHQKGAVGDLQCLFQGDYVDSNLEPKRNEAEEACLLQ